MIDIGAARLIGRGKFLQLLDRSTWEFVDRPNTNGVADIVALTNDDHLVLVEQFRHPVNKSVIELPGGLIGDGPTRSNEDAFITAKRELLEETGYRAGKLTVMASGGSSPGHSTEIVTIFLATDLQKVGAGGGDEDEDIKLHEVPLTDLDEWLNGQVESGRIIDLRVFAGLYLAQKHRLEDQKIVSPSSGSEAGKGN